MGRQAIDDLTCPIPRAVIDKNQLKVITSPTEGGQQPWNCIANDCFFVVTGNHERDFRPSLL
jgi:hypothetical protein